MRRDDLPRRTYNVTCVSGYNSGLIVPAHAIAYLEDIQIDTANISGQVLPHARLIVRDYYTVSSGNTGGVTTVMNRKQVSLKAGDDIHIDVEGVQLFGAVELQWNCSGPQVALGVAFEM